jgi:homoserine O-succinyltransferase/O-acetyltransferase
MPVEIEPPAVPHVARTPPQPDERAAEVIIGLVNNMPDTALHSTEIQFAGLLQAASGGRALRLRFTSLPGLPRSPEALEHLHRSYWSFEELLASPLDALIVTGTEPRAAVLTEEPYWQHFVRLLSFAREHTVASIWSCLAAHGAALIMHGIERQRLPEKRCGVYQHEILSGHPLLEGVSAPLPMPHSRWNELPPGRLRAAGYTVLSWSDETGADAFVRKERSALLFFQGHPEYEDTTLLKEYRRDVGRYLNGQQPHYPTVPRGYLSAEAAELLAEFRDRALASRTPALLESFPFAAIAASLDNSWRPAAVALYRNWLSLITRRR